MIGIGADYIHLILNLRGALLGWDEPAFDIPSHRTKAARKEFFKKRDRFNKSISIIS
jgi:hypothetical protein